MATNQHYKNFATAINGFTTPVSAFEEPWNALIPKLASSNKSSTISIIPGLIPGYPYSTSNVAKLGAVPVKTIHKFRSGMHEQLDGIFAFFNYVSDVVNVFFEHVFGFTEQNAVKIYVRKQIDAVKRYKNVLVLFRQFVRRKFGCINVIFIEPFFKR